MLILLFGGMGIFCAEICAQTHNDRHANGANASTVYTGLQVNDSCIYATGVFTSAAGQGTSVFIAKLRLDGTELWYKNYSDSAVEYETWTDCFITTLDGGFANAGYTYDWSFSPAEMKVLLVKFDEYGDTTWTKQIAAWDTLNNNHFVPRAMLQLPDSSFVIAANVDFDHGQFDSQVVLIKTDQNGNVLWIKEHGTILHNTVGSLMLADDGGFIIGGSRSNIRESSNNFVAYSQIIKTDSAGNFQWQNLSDENLVWTVNDLHETPDGGYIYASGYGTEVVASQNSSTLLFQSYVVKLDDQLEVEWDLILHGNPYPWSDPHLQELADDNYLCADIVFTEESSEILAGYNYNDFGRMAKLSPTGDLLWERWYFPPNVSVSHRNFINDLKVTDNGYAMVGESSDYNAASQGQQGWLIITDTAGCLVPGCASVGQEELDPQNPIAIYPNPTSNQFSLDLTLSEGSEFHALVVVDALGKEVYNAPIPFHNTSYVISVEGWPAGIYTCIIIGDQQRFAAKVIVLK